MQTAIHLTKIKDRERGGSKRLPGSKTVFHSPNYTAIAENPCWPNHQLGGEVREPELLRGFIPLEGTCLKKILRGKRAPYRFV